VTETVWLDGRLTEEPALSPADRGFTLADGVFETIRCRAGVPLWLPDHLARLRHGASQLGIPLSLDDRLIARGIADLLAARGLAEAAVRLTLTRGPAAQRGLWPPGEPVRPTLLATAAPLRAPGPVRVTVARITRRNEHSPLSGMKSLNYGDNLIARREAAGRGFDDALLLNTSGALACASVANAFVRLDGRWRTPPLRDGVLPGLARARLLALLPAEEARVMPHDLARVEAMILANSLALTPVTALDDRDLGEVRLPEDELYGLPA
jgi:branched-chain amino acid aminotransferase